MAEVKGMTIIVERELRNLAYIDGSRPVSGARVEYHPYLTGAWWTASRRPCDKDGNFLPFGAPPPPKEPRPLDDFSPYEHLPAFRMAEFVYRRVQMSADEIDELMDILASYPEFDGVPPFQSHQHLYGTIDATERGHIPWQKFEVKYDGPLDGGETVPWKHETYSVYFRETRDVLRQQLQNTGFAKEFDVAPKRVYGRDGKCRYRDFMSGRWAWRQADEIAKDPDTHDAVFVPIISGSDKTTTSVATGANEFYPMYMSNGLVHNEVRRAHRNAVSVVAFLAIPKTDREHANSVEFRTFGRRLFHASLRRIFASLKPGMTKWEVMLFPDGHYRRVIFGLGPYIADYPEQVLLACVVQGWCARCTAKRDDLDGPAGRRTQSHTEALFEALDHKRMWDEYGVISDVLPFTWDFPRADIHEILSPDLLHQIIKGTFKDHLVTWVGDYLELIIAAVPAFPGLRRFPQGRGFKQWTGDDSKALMKVYLPAIEGHVPPQMVRAFSAFLDFCYLVRRNDIGEGTLEEIEAALARSGPPNGLCSSITESKHIKAVKEPWRRSSRYEALTQMLTINNRLDNLAASRVDFTQHDDHPDVPEHPGAEPGCVASFSPTVCSTLMSISVRGYPRDPTLLGNHLNIPRLPDLIQRFLYAQDHLDRDIDIDLSTIPLNDCPPLPSKVMCFPSAIATFYAPSDQCATSGLFSERIRATRSWRGGPARYDCVYVDGEDDVPGFRGLLAARHNRKVVPCALVTWFSAIGERPCDDVGMWMVEPDLDGRGHRVLDIIHIDSIVRGAHLIPVFGDDLLPRRWKYTDSLDSFKAYYINKYADHHSHEIAF
ncbi:hypothetical protein C8F01DRAFT_1209068 [Mycena amicta]|nr:hypothetical protein C8F01DRAFT_1209068 [Mycena amicta]